MPRESCYALNDYVITRGDFFSSSFYESKKSLRVNMRYSLKLRAFFFFKYFFQENLYFFDCRNNE
jgi:hypothetical protein